MMITADIKQFPGRQTQLNTLQGRHFFHPGKGNSFLNNLHLQLIDSTAVSDALVVQSATVMLTAKFDKTSWEMMS
jgi:hypothetical protein